MSHLTINTYISNYQIKEENIHADNFFYPLLEINVRNKNVLLLKLKLQFNKKYFRDNNIK